MAIFAKSDVFAQRGDLYAMWNDPVFPAIVDKFVNDPARAAQLHDWTVRIGGARNVLGFASQNAIVGGSDLIFYDQQMYGTVIKTILSEIFSQAEADVLTLACSTKAAGVKCFADKPLGADFAYLLAGSGGRDELCPASDMDTIGF